MTTYNHIAWGFLFGYLLNSYKKWYVIVPFMLLFGFMGALPDIIGQLEKWIYHNESWVWYGYAHHWMIFISYFIVLLIFKFMKYDIRYSFFFDSIRNTAILLFPYGLHLLLDGITHGENGWIDLGFKYYEGYGWTAEIVSWLIIIGILMKWLSIRYSYDANKF